MTILFAYFRSIHIIIKIQVASFLRSAKGSASTRWMRAPIRCRIMRILKSSSLPSLVAWSIRAWKISSSSSLSSSFDVRCARTWMPRKGDFKFQFLIIFPSSIIYMISLRIHGFSLSLSLSLSLTHTHTQHTHTHTLTHTPTLREAAPRSMGAIQQELPHPQVRGRVLLMEEAVVAGRIT